MFALFVESTQIVIPMQKREEERLYLGHRKRIRQRFIDFGYDILLDYEKLELFLTLCIPRKDVKDIAKKLLNRFGSISAVINASSRDLSKIDGVGESVICNIKILRMCINSHLFESLKNQSLSLDTVELLARYFESRLANLDYEVLEILCLDSQLKLLGNAAFRVAKGGVNSVNIDNRKIIELALENRASSIVLCHNHPRGLSTPSKEDINFTKALSTICKCLKLDFIEHLIIAQDTYFSFRRQGHLDLLYDSTLHEPKANISSPKKSLI